MVEALASGTVDVTDIDLVSDEFGLGGWRDGFVLHHDFLSDAAGRDARVTEETLRTSAIHVISGLDDLPLSVDLPRSLGSLSNIGRIDRSVKLLSVP